LKKFGLQYSDDDIKSIVKNRNSIVHTVRFDDISINHYEDYTELKLLLDLMLLKILDYSGYIINYANGYKREKLFG